MGMPPFVPEEQEEETTQTVTPKIRAAMEWLAIELIAGPRPASDLISKAQADGHAKRTVQLASQLLHVTKTRSYGPDGRHTGAVWELPTVQVNSTRNK